jgi:hypothetical protein
MEPGMIKFGVILIAGIFSWFLGKAFAHIELFMLPRETIDPKLRERCMAPELSRDEQHAMYDAAFDQMSEHRRMDKLLGLAMTVTTMLLLNIAFSKFFLFLDSVLK